MLRGTRLVALSASLTAALLLTGCTSEPAPATTVAPVPSATSTPAFTSKEEAFKAAEKVYRQYLTLGQVLARKPKVSDVGVLAPLVTAPALIREAQTQQRARASGVHLDGPQVLEVFQGQTADLSSGDVAAYVCVNFSKARIIDKSGKDVTPADRPTTSSTVAHFVVANGALRLDREDDYSGRALC